MLLPRKGNYYYYHSLDVYMDQDLNIYPPEADLCQARPGATSREHVEASVIFPTWSPLTRDVQSQPALVRRDVDMQQFSLLMNASLSITPS